MATAACLPIAADRVGPCVRTIFFEGYDLSGVVLAMELRFNPETPGPALIALGMAPTVQDQGLRFVGVTIKDGIPTSEVAFRISEATMKDAAKVPYTGELGSAALLYYDLIGTFGPDRRRLVYGTLSTAPTVFGMDAAPANRVAGNSVADASGAWSSARLTFSDDVVRISVDGVEQLGEIAERLSGFRDEAEQAAGQATVAKDAALVALDSAAVSALVLDLRGGTGSALSANGATFIRRAGEIVGLSVAGGATGQTAFLNVIRTRGLQPAGLAKVRSRVDLSFAVSATFDRAVSLTFYSFDPGEVATLIDPVGAVTSRVEGGVLTLSGTYDIPADAVGFQETATLTSTSPTGAVQTIELLSTSLRPAVSDGGQTRSDVALDAWERQLFAAVKRDQRIYGRQVLVTAPGQGGDYTSIKAAIAAVQPHAGPGSRALVLIAPKPGAAAYAERSIVADYVDLVSLTPELVYIDGSQPDNAPPADITAYSTFDRLGDVYMERIHAVMTNGRYVVHWDDAWSAGKLWKTKDCTFWHKGNEGARQYQIGQGRDPDAFGTAYYIWRTLCAAGCGTWDDCHAEFYNSVFKSPAYPFAVHDQQNGPFGVKQSTLLFDACLIRAGVTVNPANGAVTEGNPTGIGAMEFTSYGQPATNRAIIRNSTILGKIDVTKPGVYAGARSRWVFDGEGNSLLDWNVPFAGGAAAVSRVL